jgi:hypothetical protein
LQHDDASRNRSHAVKDRQISDFVNKVYMTARLDLMHLVHRNPELDFRKQLYQTVSNFAGSVLNGQPAADMELSYGRGKMPGMEMDRTLYSDARRLTARFSVRQ